MFRKQVLDNGTRVVTDYIPYLNTVSIGIWIEAGSSDEQKEENGYSHFIEHMLFKGTKKRNAIEIAKSVDRIGGQINAYTEREYTHFCIDSRTTYLKESLNILADMLNNSVFLPEEILKEKQVILEEINMHADNPDELIHDTLMETVFSNSSLGRSIIGTEEAIRQVSREKLKNYFTKTYLPPRVVIAIAGKFNFKEALKHIESLKILNNNSGTIVRQVKPQFSVASKIIKKKLEQVHFVIGFPGLKRSSDSRHALYVMNNILGGSMSSRLFVELREKRGLCYSVYSFHNNYRENGLFGIYCATGPNNYKKAIDLIMEQCKKIRNGDVSASEISLSKEQLKGHLELSNEASDYRMQRIAKQEITFRKNITHEQVIKSIEKVTRNDIHKIAKNIFTKPAIISVGKDIQPIKVDNII